MAAQDAPITVFVVQQSGVQARGLGPVDSLAAAIARFAGLIESGVDATRLGRRLGSRLLDPALTLLAAGVTRITVVPDGPLHRLPFDALRLASGQYAVERYALSIAPSAAVVTTLRARPAHAQAASSLRLLAPGHRVPASRAFRVGTHVSSQE